MHETKQSSLFATYNRPPLAFERGSGSYLFTADGDKYLDFASGIAVNALGHAHPRLVEALTTQAEKLWHVSNLYTIPGQERLAERLCAASFADRVFFNNSGAEAVETAIKTARHYHAHNGHPERYRLITFKDAFHGRTMATIAAGGKEAYLDGFGPALDGFDKMDAPDIDLVAAAITDATAGVLIEPIQGEGGVNTFDPSFLRALRQLCDDKGLLLVMDEVQSGMGRTGKLFAHEWSGITPDIMAAAKGIGGGFPLGACLATEKAAASMVPGTHGTTYGGNPLAMAVGNAVLDALLEPGFIEEVADKGLYLRQKLAALQDANSDLIKEVRGQGLLLGLAMTEAPAGIIEAATKEHLLTVGAAHNVIRLLPPLNCSMAELDEAVTSLEKALEKYRRLRSSAE
jgi:acetylornithine/N-succinyldiaminopimelate aminotransferase